MDEWWMIISFGWFWSTHILTCSSNHEMERVGVLLFFNDCKTHFLQRLKESGSSNRETILILFLFECSDTPSTRLVLSTFTKHKVGKTCFMKGSSLSVYSCICSPRLCGFIPGPQFSSDSPKTCTQNCPWMCLIQLCKIMNLILKYMKYC